MLKLKKKAESMEIKGMLPLIVTFLIVVIIISLGADVLDDVRDTQTNSQNTLANNESLTWAGNNTAISLANNELGIVSGTIVLYNNGTKVAENGNYTYTTSGTITIINSSAFGDPEWLTTKLNITYAYYFGSTGRNATVYGLSAQNTFAKWMPTIAMVLVVAIILGILLVYLVRRSYQ